MQPNQGYGKVLPHPTRFVHDAEFRNREGEVRGENETCMEGKMGDKGNIQ